MPASFDAAAQRLTLDAAREAGFPADVRLLEEPQAAFYHWLGRRAGESAASKELSEMGVRHVLVIDIGGGTTDFTLFEICSLKPGHPFRRSSELPSAITFSSEVTISILPSRIGSNHGSQPREPLSEVQRNFLVARCRDVKERCLADFSDSRFFGFHSWTRFKLCLATHSARQIERAEIESIVLDGFFPECNLDDKPARTQVGLREWALPYAADSAVTRYLAEFLRGRPGRRRRPLQWRFALSRGPAPTSAKTDRTMAKRHRASDP